MPPDEIVSNHTVYSETECSMRCVPKSTCVGFNYRAKRIEYVVNCQLSNKTHGKENGKGGENGEWIFYKVMQKTVSKEEFGYSFKKCCYHTYYEISITFLGDFRGLKIEHRTILQRYFSSKQMRSFRNLLDQGSVK